MSYVRQAFDRVCDNAKPAEAWYVCLMRASSRYGGPEEGGWWIHDTEVVAFKQFPTEELATAAKEQIDKLAEELTEDSRRSYDLSCLRSMEWLEERGLDADFLPEPDGHDQYQVIVSSSIPEPSFGPTHYE